MHVLYLSSEVAPYAKTGGLADVAGALPVALAELGLQVTVVTPFYASTDAERLGLAKRLRTLDVTLGAKTYSVSLYEGRLAGSQVPIYLIDYPPMFGRKGIYGEGGTDYPDNAERFALLSRAALEVAAKVTSWPDIVHANDWQTALAPFFLRHGMVKDAKPTKTVLTIHNLAFQGLFPKQTVDTVGLGWEHFHMDGIEFFDQVSFLKAGILAADRLTTVSPRYSREIQEAEHGCGLEGLLRGQTSKLSGILNGIDVRQWDPTRDPYLPSRYSVSDRAGKAICKEQLQRIFGLPSRKDVPVLGSISRLTEQKGFDLVAAIAKDLASPSMDVQYVVLGSGDEAIEKRLKAMAVEAPNKLAVRIAYDEAIAHLIEAGADLFVMPSRFEPCGLNQMYSLRYGTLPVVRATGGLDDTVVDYDPRTRSGNGFKFEEYEPQALLGAIRRGIATYKDAGAWSELVTRAMRQDFSWAASGRQYVDLYRRA